MTASAIGIERNKDCDIARVPPVHSRPCVVMLHSSMSSSRQWRVLAEQLKSTYRVVAIDLIGYGDAAMPLDSGAFGLEHEVAHVLEVMEGLATPVTEFHLIGHSYGGAVALRLAHAMPSRVCSLLVYEPTAFHLLPNDHPALNEARHLAAIVCESAGEGVDAAAALISTEAFIDFWSGVGAFASMEERQQLAMTRALPKTALDFQALFDDPLTAHDYRELSVDTCVISGSRSPNCAHQIVAVLADVLPRHTLRWVRAGHMAPVTHPHLVNPMIEAFLASMVSRKARLPQARVSFARHRPAVLHALEHELTTCKY
jgi:pimeloyl-ACP methyl ester carboxylesterase